MTRARTALLLSLPLLLTGCEPLDQIWSWHLQDVVADVLLYGALGAFLGGLFGLASYLFLNSRGKFDVDLRLAGLLRGLTALTLVLGCGLGGGGAGACVGAVSGCDKAIRGSPVGKKFLPEAAAAGADFTFYLVKVGEVAQAASKDPDKPLADAWNLDTEILEGFHEGRTQLQVDTIQSVLEEMPQDGSAAVVQGFTDKVLGTVEEKDKATARAVTEWSLQFVLEQLITRQGKKVGKSAGKIGRTAFDFELAAKRKGDPEQLNHAELKEHYVDALIVPVIVLLLGKAVSPYKLGCLALMLLLPLAPLIFFWILRKIFGAPKPDADDTPKDKDAGAPTDQAPTTPEQGAGEVQDGVGEAEPTP